MKTILFILFLGFTLLGFSQNTLIPVNQISDIGKEYEVDPIKDLIPVCPNCHAMIHSKRPAFTIEEIKEIRKTTDNN